jgi:hypothetical protein
MSDMAAFLNRPVVPAVNIHRYQTLCDARAREGEPVRLDNNGDTDAEIAKFPVRPS